MIPPEVEYVYAIRCANAVKIGRTTDVEKRFSQLQTGNANRLELIHVHACENNAWFEAALHKALEKHRLCGEWFDILDHQYEAAIEKVEEQYLAAMLLEDLATQITLHRKKRGMTQEELAKLANVRQVTVSKVENAGGNIETYLKIAKALDMSLVLVPVG